MPDPIHFTQPDVFIIESLSLEDEEAGRFEGKVLADVLKMCGKNPRYMYLRTKDELVLAAQLFLESGYRYLHFSSHGSANSVHTTLDDLSYVEFAEIFEGVLKNRRFFMSACELGNELFSVALLGRNKGMYSIAAPTEKILFSHAVGLWVAFYTKLFSANGSYMKNHPLRMTLQNLSNLYGIDFHFSWHNTYFKRLEHEVLVGISPREYVKAAKVIKGNRPNNKLQPIADAPAE